MSECDNNLAPTPFRPESFVLVNSLATIRFHHYYRQAKADERYIHKIEFALN